LLFSAAYKRYALATLTTVYMLNLVDRGLMALLLQPIKEDLHLSDTQLGLLTGIVFALFYALAGLPIARWADRGNRVSITSLAIALWGLTVMACPLISNYAQLMFARMAAAVGESGCKPPTYSLVGDYFPGPAERTRAMSIYWMGSPLAMLVSFVLGGWLNDLYGWRIAFFVMGVPGLMLAALVRLTIAEPRMHASFREVPRRSLPPMKVVLAILWQRRSCRHLCIALIVTYTISFGLSPWYAAFMMRSHGVGTAELGLSLGLMFSLGGIAGLLLGGHAANRWFAGNERGQLRMSALAIAAVVPCFVTFLIAPQKHQALAALLPLAIVFILFMGPSFALLQRLVPDEMRATMMALIMLLANLIGMGTGPQIVGILSDYLMPAFGRDSLRYAMLTMSFLGLWSAWHFWRAGEAVAADIAAAEACHAKTSG
jgi:MFS family permease